jgi:hypothetical protein
MTIHRFYVFTLLFIFLHDNACASDANDHSIGSGQRHLRSIGKVKNFRLINADTNLPIITLTNDMVIDIATLGTENLNIRATTTNGTIVAIRFGYNGNSKFRTDALRPYALCGDGLPVGNYYVCKELVAGSHSISATPYSVSGEVGETAKLSFTISGAIVQNDPDLSIGSAGEGISTKSPTSGDCIIEKVQEISFIMVEQHSCSRKSLTFSSLSWNLTLSPFVFIPSSLNQSGINFLQTIQLVLESHRGY